MRIASYNVQRAQYTYSSLINFVKRRDIDVICVQEADDWHKSQGGQPPRLEEFPRLSGLTHAAFGDSNTDCKLITFSRHPITKTEVFTKGFTHCIIKTIIEGNHGPVNVVNAHLTPYSARERYYEARRLTKIAGRDAIIALDTNNPHREDNPNNVLRRSLMAQSNYRYGIKQMCYGAIDHIIQTGYIDAAQYTGNDCNTYPTPIQTDPFHAHVMRLDCIFVPPELAEAIKDFEIIKDEVTDLISDHYPAVITVGPPTAASQGTGLLPVLQPEFSYAAA